MEKNIKNNNAEIKFLFKIIFCFTFLLIVFLVSPQYFNKSFGAEAESNAGFCYLSDIPYVANQSSVGWGKITLDQNLETKYNNGLITLLVEGKQKKFLKGISAHATSTLIYDISGLNYDYFSTYYGVDASRGTNGNGVKFAIYTSADGENWDLHTLVSPPVKKGNTNAEYINIDIRGKNYIKLYAHNNGNATADHACYANAKLYKEGFENAGNNTFDYIKTVEEYDNIIKSHKGEEIAGEYELAILQRNLVKKVGYDILQLYANLSTEKEQVFSSVFNNADNLRLLTIGGKPEGSYIKCFDVLAKLYKAHGEDLSNKTLIDTQHPEKGTLGDLYKRMMYAISLTHSGNVYLWITGGNTSDPVTRYEIYKDLYANNLIESRTFETLKVEEMRWVMNTVIDNEEIKWLNNYTRTKKNGATGPYSYIRYTFGYNYNKDIYYSEENYSKWDEKYELSKYGVPYQKGNPKLWIVFEEGSVCGGLSKTGSCVWGAYKGLPNTCVCQPAHCAYIYYSKNAQGKGVWGLGNDVSGWAQSGRTEHLNTCMPLDWGDEEYMTTLGSDWLGSATYVLLAQGALNDFDNYQISKEILMLADVYKDEYEKVSAEEKQGKLKELEDLYEDALKKEPINIDAWYGLIKAYRLDSTKAEADFYALAERIFEKLKYYPLPMYHLEREILKDLTSPEYTFKFTMLQTKTLNEAKNATDAQTIQRQAVRQVAERLLGQIDSTLAKFSFDGENSEAIVISNRYDGSDVRWDYSLDGGQTWTATSDHVHRLTDEELASITATNDIKVHIVGVDYTEENIFTIDIKESAGVPSNVYANDLENRMIGVNLSTQWRYTEQDGWTSYRDASPDLTGDKTVQLRQGATGTTLASKNSTTYTFTKDNQPDTRKYVPVSHLSIKAVSSQATGGGQNGNATYAIDGNFNTRWHSAWNGSDKEKYIIIQLDQAIDLSAIEYAPSDKSKRGNGNILQAEIYGSMDGETYEKIGTTTDWNNEKEMKAIEFPERPRVQYVKIVGKQTSSASSLSFITARMFNFYQDLTKNPAPTAGIAYSTKETTNGSVVARLVNPSTEIIITNNDGKDTYLFTKNGEFTFEFEDAYGQIGTATAKVTWIDTDAPTADVEYELNSEKKLLVLLDNISEDVYLLDEDNNKINYVEVKDNKVSSISYLDAEGIVYKTVEVDETGAITKVRYKNTTNVSGVDEYITIIENGVVVEEQYVNYEGRKLTLSEAQKVTLRTLQSTMSNPLEYILETSGNYEFKLLDKASNITSKNVKVDYINNDTIILASDITYNITTLTKNNVVATLNPYIIDTNNNKDMKVEIVNNNKNKQYTFKDNGEFTFKYKSSYDVDDLEVKEHIAKVTWIDNVPPTAEIKYSTTESTNKSVIATLVNESEEITIINKGDSRQHIFTENGEFTFEFVDKAGNKGTAKAVVNWIKKDQEDTTKIGDVNKDGKITSTDLLLVKRHLVAGEKQEWILKEDRFKAGDINSDGNITATDLILIKRLVLKQMET